PGEQEAPPEPVRRDAALAEEVGDEIRCIGAEGGGDHRDADEPPGRRASGSEELARVLARAAPEEERRQEADRDARADYDPIERGEMEGRAHVPRSAPSEASRDRTIPPVRRTPRSRQ